MAHARAENVLRPRDRADLVEILRSHPRPLEPIGGGSKRAIGAPVDADPLELSAFSGIVAYEPAELVLTARAATPLATIEAELARRGQRLAFEPPDFGALLGAAPCGAQTIGGVLAANLAGSRRVSAGAARDHFLGFEAVSGDGVPFKAGGRVVKNVTGYDLPKLLAGSWGTLAVLVSVTVRVAPMPETETTIVVPVRDPAAAVDVLGRGLGSPHDVSAAAFAPGRGAALRLEGFGASVAARVQGLLEWLGCDDADVLADAESHAFWRRTGEAAELGDAPCVVRISVPPSDAPRVLDAIEPERYLLDWGGGLIWAAFADVDIDRIRSVIHEGHATLWKAPRRLRESVAVFPPLPAAVATLAAKLKSAFDPDGRLNPGRMGPPVAPGRRAFDTRH
ncbi:MAG TPA: FAD-binding protein [Gammaproteobacteria bacterium]